MSTLRSKSSVPAARQNALPLDDAPLLTLGSGLEGRFGLCPCSALKSNPDAVRVHPERQIDKLARAIAVTGPLEPVIIGEDYTILSGHARVAAIRKTSEVVPVIQILGLSEAQKRIFLLSANRIGEDGRLDREKLAQQIPQLTVLFERVGFELSDTGFEIAELDTLSLDFADASGVGDDVDPDLLQEPCGLRAGDLIELGPHRLAVGTRATPICWTA